MITDFYVINGLHKMITEMNLRDYNLGAISIRIVFNKFVCLVKIDLSHNGLDNESVEIISQNLKTNYIMKSINISHNYITDISSLCEVLKINRIIEDLDVSGNPFGNQWIMIMGIPHKRIRYKKKKARNDELEQITTIQTLLQNNLHLRRQWKLENFYLSMWLDKSDLFIPYDIRSEFRDFLSSLMI